MGGKYSDEWQRLHLISPRDLVPESIMPAYPWLEKAPADAGSIQQHMRALRAVGVPYTDDQIAAAPAELAGKTELDAMVAYLQGLGLALKYGGIDYGHQLIAQPGYCGCICRLCRYFGLGLPACQESRF